MELGWIAVLALVGAVPAAAPLAAAPHRAAAKDWSRTVVMTPAGGFRMGNPDASVRLVEYGSLTCPHCAHFAAEAMPELKALVRSGKLSFEYRNYILNGVDIAASLIARCGGAKSFFPVAEAMYGSQREWIGAITGLDAEQKRAIAALPPVPRLQRFADASGLLKVAAKHGVTADQARQCLADDEQMARLDSLHRGAQQLGVARTPTFFVDGTQVDASDWGALEPVLREALGKSG